MTFAWGSDDPALRKVDVETLHHRFNKSGIQTKYYTPEIHRASFALPKYITDAIAESLD